jgi:hypothetical protein
MGADALTIRDYPVQAYDALILRLANMDTVRTVKLITTSLAFASLGLTALVSAAFAGKMDALVGDWDLNRLSHRRHRDRHGSQRDYMEIRLDKERQNSRTRT